VTTLNPAPATRRRVEAGGAACGAEAFEELLADELLVLGPPS
jgi:hypothetical protein